MRSSARALRRRTRRDRRRPCARDALNGVKHTSSGPRPASAAACANRAIAAASVVDVGDGRRVDRRRHPRRRRERRPPVAVLRRPGASRPAELPPTQIGGCGCCTGRRQHDVRPCVPGPRRPSSCERVVEPLRPVRRTATPSAANSDLEVADRDPEDHAAARQQRRASRSTSRPDSGSRYAGIEAVRVQPQASWSPRPRTPAPTNGSRVAWPPCSSHSPRRARVVGHEARVEARGLDRRRARRRARRARRPAARRENFTRRPSRRAAASSVRASRRTRAGLPPGRGGPTST